MSLPRTIPDLVRMTQARAANPEVSAFVSANAGAGKTHVLVQRVIRLLLKMVPSERADRIGEALPDYTTECGAVEAISGISTTLDEDW